MTSLRKAWSGFGVVEYMNCSCRTVVTDDNGDGVQLNGENDWVFLLNQSLRYGE